MRHAQIDFSYLAALINGAGGAACGGRFHPLQKEGLEPICISNGTDALKTVENFPITPAGLHPSCRPMRILERTAYL